MTIKLSFSSVKGCLAYAEDGKELCFSVCKSHAEADKIMIQLLMRNDPFYKKG